MNIPNRPLNRIGTWPVGGEVPQRDARMSGKPLLDFLGFRQRGVIDDDRETGEKRCGEHPIKRF
jgi:hypothetical protein